MTTVLTTKDLEKLKGVDARMRAIVLDVSEDPNAPPFTVLEGLRTLERQKELKATGKSRTLKSKHLEGLAVDLAPLPINWNDLSPFKALKAAMLRAAKARGVRIRSGSDWDENGVPDQDELKAYIKKFGHRPLVDWPHYEIVGK